MNITNDKAIEKIREIIKEKGSQIKAAEHLDISAQYLSEILKGHRPISDEVAKKLGYKRVVSFEPIKE